MISRSSFPAVERIEFANGEIWTAGRIAEIATTVGGSLGDFIEGTAGDDRIDGRAGDDTIDGLAGSDWLAGGAGNDTLVGGEDDDIFAAGALVEFSDGDDLIIGGFGDDTYDASAIEQSVIIDLGAATATGVAIGNDTLSGIENAIGGLGDDTLTGGNFGNRLDGGAGSDVLAGANGNDTLVGGRGGDILIGGDGIDVADYSASLAGVTVDLVAGTGSAGDALGDQLSGIENITGSNYADDITGDSQANVLTLGAGDDTAIGGGGGDTIEGGDGADVLAGGLGNDDLSGGIGSDVISGGSGIDTIEGGAGADALSGGDGGDLYLWTPGDGSDVIIESQAVEGDVDLLQIDGLSTDVIDYVRVRDDLVIRLRNGEQITVEHQFAGDVAGTAGIGIERIEFLGDGVLLVRTEFDGLALEFENIAPFAFGDIVETDIETPLLLTPADLLANDGDFEGDQLSIVSVGDGVNGTVEINVSGNVLFTPEVEFTGVASFIYGISDGRGGTASAQVDITVNPAAIVGTPGRDLLIGTPGNDFIDAGNDVDYIRGNAGADTIDGGASADWSDYVLSDAGVAIDLGGGQASGGHAAGDVLISIENLFGSSYDDELRGNDGANTILGNTGDDVLSGAGGADWLRGDAGADTINGGAGFDTAAYSSSSAGVTVDLATGQNHGGDAEGDILTDIEKLIGSVHADVLSGNESANTLLGLTGDDLLSGGGGNDWLRGDIGADTLDGGDGGDWADYYLSDAAVTIDLGTGLGSGGHADGDVLVAVENLFGSSFGDVLSGNAGANTILGNAGDDSLYGGVGNDWLRGDAGADAINGGDGADTAAYSSSNVGVTVNLATGLASGGHAQGDVLIDIEDLIGSSFDDFLTGDAGANRLLGGSGADNLSSGSGDDLLIGGAGNDTLDGGQGADRFLFLPNFGQDELHGFTPGEDVIDLFGFNGTVAQLLADAVSNGAGTSISFSDGSSIFVHDVAVSSLSDDDFRFL